MFVTKVKKTNDLDLMLQLFVFVHPIDRLIIWRPNVHCSFIAIESKSVTSFRAMKAKLPPAAEWAAPLMTKASLE